MVKISDIELGEFPLLLAPMEDVSDPPFRALCKENGADVVSTSLGYLDWYEYSDMDGNTAVTTIGVDIAAGLGMVCVTAAGNSGNNDGKKMSDFDWGERKIIKAKKYEKKVKLKKLRKITRKQ